ncbi:PREDICTED: probable U3 small nucleolar RNA-associated protein 11, partial [Priapulus caudatus]|uniref:U3 small nucleolar RNA-associated protein 11 n=1 Tax=Priapulus caudatus TaxID=37621 RepID=A0ABM1EH96_PRICU
YKSGQKTHRERGQLSSRSHLGALEKKKDYKLRANDFQKKQKFLKGLKQKALERNPDEFYFKMVNSKLKDGAHIEEEKKDDLPLTQKKLMQTQDLNYINCKRNSEIKKIEKLKSGLHLLDVDGKPQNKHTFFVDTRMQAKSFDVAEHMDTAPEFLARSYNIPRLNDLSRKPIIGPSSDESLAAITKERKKNYKELIKRIERERELSVITQKMEMKKKLMGKEKSKKVTDETKSAPAIYKWFAERKR